MKRLCMIAAAWLLSAAAAFSQEYGVVTISVCNLRATAAFDAEMVSQALLGTPVHILADAEKLPQPWPQVQTPDGYTGWVHYAAIARMTEREYHAWNAAPKAIVTALAGTVRQKASIGSATISDVVGGDRLKLLETHLGWLKVAFPDGRQGYIRRSEAMPERQWRKQLDQSPEAILKTAKSMLGFPYLWAGMSPKGMDCSGFVRTVLFLHDIIIPRDSGPMSLVGERIENRSNLQPGDLLFFGSRKEDGSPRVSHVGLYLGDGLFIHSLGLVKIGSLFPDRPEFDPFNAGRYLFAGRILPYIGKDAQITTTLTNSFYAE